MKHVPNALTLLRLALAPIVVWYWLEGVVLGMITPTGDDAGRMNQIASSLTVAAALFIVAALTDLFDGMIARAFNAHSRFGRLIDPIADKAIVGLPLIAFAIVFWISRDPLWPVIAVATAVIVIRDVSMTVVRLTSPDGEGARVSFLAKVKTALELVVVGSALSAHAISASIWAASTDGAPWMQPLLQAFDWAWMAALVLAAALSAYTAGQYLHPAKRVP